MASNTFAVALNASEFPFISTFQPRPVMIPGQDGKLKNPQSSRDQDFDNNQQKVPSVLYGENIMPTRDAYMSVGYAEMQAATGSIQFDESLTLRSDDERSWQFSPAVGNNYVAEVLGVSPWASVGVTPGVAANTEVSIAYVNGKTYILYAGIALLEWNPGTLTFTNLTPPGIAVADMRSICGSINYLIITTATEVYWSTDPTDFTVPSDWAGVQIPVDLRGHINAVASQPGGFIIFSEFNAVAALYTDNSDVPWKFREVKNAGGCSTRKAITIDGAGGKTYLWGTNGLQEINLKEATNVFPDASDFLGGHMFEEFNSVTNILQVSRGVNLHVKLAFVAGRYLVLSYGVASSGLYSHALVWDSGLRRWGKLRIDHVDCFAYAAPVPALQSHRTALCFLLYNGRVMQARMDYIAGIVDAGVLILGPYQLSRGHNICSQELEIEGADFLTAVTVDVLANFNGTNLGQQLAMQQVVAYGRYTKFAKQIEGKNITYIIKGSFDLSTVMPTVTKGAKF